MADHPGAGALVARPQQFDPPQGRAGCGRIVRVPRRRQRRHLPAVAQRAGFGPRGMTDQPESDAMAVRPQRQPPAGGKAERRGIAMNFRHHRRKRRAGQSFFRRDQHVARMGGAHQQRRGLQSGQPGPTGQPRALPVLQPQHRPIQMRHDKALKGPVGGGKNLGAAGRLRRSVRGVRGQDRGAHSSDMIHEVLHLFYIFRPTRVKCRTRLGSTQAGEKGRNAGRGRRCRNLPDRGCGGGEVLCRAARCDGRGRADGGPAALQVGTGRALLWPTIPTGRCFAT